MQTLIHTEELRKIYLFGDNEVRALDGLTMSVGRGEFVAISGCSGSGKTTLMNVLGCLDQPTSGSYMLDGQDVSSMTDGELSGIRNREIGFIFQSFNLIPGLTAVENAALPLIYRGIPKLQRRERALAALEKVGLGNRVMHRPSQMSGGQQQRVAIARAIAAEPAIILADEPTGNLDSNAGADVMSILHDLNKSGKTILLITHDEQLAHTAQRLIRIRDGRIEKDERLP